MKHIVIFIILNCLLTSCDKNEIPCIPSDLQNHVVAFYPFSSGSLHDVSGNDLHLVNPNNIKSVSDRDGSPSCSYSFDGSSRQFLSRHGRFTDDFHKGTFSISLWYRPIGNRDVGDYELILGRVSKFDLEIPSKYGEWSIGLYDCRRAVFSINRKSKWDNFHYLWSNDTLGDKCELESAALSNIWHHLIVTFDGKNRTLFKNGIASSIIESSGSGSMSRNLGDLVIGRGFNGEIDDIIIFDKVLDQNEVNQLYNLTPCCQ